MDRVPGHTYLALGDIAAERERQHAKWGQQDHPDGTGTPTAAAVAGLLRAICQEAHPTDTYAKILAEEIGEAFTETDPVKLRDELVQAGAVLTQWVEAIDRRLAAFQNTRPGDVRRFYETSALNALDRVLDDTERMQGDPMPTAPELLLGLGRAGYALVRTEPRC